MKHALAAALIVFATACSSPGDNAPRLAPSEVVVLAYQPADLVAARVCGILHGVAIGSPEDRAGGCSSRECARAHHADGSTHVSLIADASTNSLVVTAPPGHEADLERALEIVKQVDRPATGAKATIDERELPASESGFELARADRRPLPDGAVSIEVAHADAREIARVLNDLDEASFWAAQSRRGCVLYAPLDVLDVPESTSAESSRLDFDAGGWRELDRNDPEVVRVREELELVVLREHLAGGWNSMRHSTSPPPHSFRARDRRTLVVLEAGRDEEYLPSIRDLVARLDQPELARPREDR